MTLIQCFGSARNLNIHFHIVFIDGVYVTTSDRLTFRRVPPTVAALERLVRVISARVGRALERQGLLVRDLENPFLTVDSPDGAGFDDLLGHSITKSSRENNLTNYSSRVLKGICMLHPQLGRSNRDTVLLRR